MSYLRKSLIYQFPYFSSRLLPHGKASILTIGDPSFAAVMLLGAVVAQVLLPEVQNTSTRLSIDLETLAEGRRMRGVPVSATIPASAGSQGGGGNEDMEMHTNENV